MISISNCPICSNTLTSTHLTCTDYTTSKEQFTIKVCEICCFGVTTPRPQELDSYYLSSKYISHAKKAKSFLDWVYVTARKYTLREKYKLIRRYNLQDTIPKVLDIGCGTGEFLKYLESKKLTVAGVEPSKQANVLAKEIKGTVYTTLEEVTQEKYNIITLWHVLEHIPDLHATLALLKHRLTADGTLFIAVPNFQSKDAKAYGNFWAGYDVPRHLWHFSQKSIRKLLIINDLRIVETVPMKLDSFYVSLLSEKYRAGRHTLKTILNAIVIGQKSNRRAQENGEYSSLIYVIKKIN